MSKDGVSGTMIANGYEVDANRTQTKSHSAYILQTDFLNPVFTVNEIMMHAANVKLESELSRKSKLELIGHLLCSVSMNGVRNVVCSKLSGGERKRLNVCLELLGNHPILFLDEPTSGLDSNNCRLLVAILKKLADEGRTIICTIHQPSATILSMFDHLHFICSGRTVFHGDVTNLLPFLSFVGLPCPLFHNPADFTMDLMSGEFGCHIDKLINANSLKNWSSHETNLISNNEVRSENLEIRNEHLNTYCAWFKFKCLVTQLYTQLYRDWSLVYLKWILHMLTALIFGALFYNFGGDATKVQVNSIFIFMSTFYVWYITLMSATLKYPYNFMVLRKEHFNNWYKFSTYFFAYLAVNIPVQIILSYTFISIAYWLTGQLYESVRGFIILGTVALETIMAEMTGLILGSSEKPINGLVAGVVILIYFTCFAGCIAPLANMSRFLLFLSNFSLIKYSFELKMTAAYGLNRRKLICPDETLYCHMRNTKMIFDYFGVQDGRVAHNFVIMSFWTMILIVIAYYVLKYRLKRIH